MTEAEAREIIKDILAEATAGEDAVSYVTECDKEPLELAIKALEKQIAKKPVLVTRADGIIKFYPCPTCSTAEKYESVYPKQKHCTNCGQALLWENSEV